MKKTISFMVLVLMVMAVSLTGCRKSYDVPEYEDVKSNETAFVIPLEGDVGKQAKLNSAEQVEKYKVMAKRIQVTHRWNQTGRWEMTGKWIPNVMVIKVDRTPVTREWTTTMDKGTANKDEGIWAESSDSVGFSTGISITGMVDEKNTALFLYRYQSQSLAQVMDTEVRARLQAVFADFASEYDMSVLRSKKKELLEKIRKDVCAFFLERGISITTIGQFGGFTYENAKIQESIDGVFIAQREKDVNAAKLEAQKDKNARMEQEGQGIAKKLREEAKGKKDAAITAAEGEAQAITMVAKAAASAASNPVFIKLKELEVKLQQIKKWDGKLPVYNMTLGDSKGSPMQMLNIPAPK